MGATEPIIKIEIEQVREKLTQVFRAHNDDIQRMVEKSLEKYCTEEWLQQIVDKQVVELLEKASKASYEYSWTAMQAIDKLIGETINKRIIAIAESPEPTDKPARRPTAKDFNTIHNQMLYLRRQVSDICAERERQRERLINCGNLIAECMAKGEYVEARSELDNLFGELGAEEEADET